MIKVNEYFDGNVKSLGIDNNDGKTTVGVMAPGKYAFGTSTVEIMNVITGELDVQLPGNNEWKTYKNGESFRVEKDVTFNVKCAKDVAYWCQYL